MSGYRIQRDRGRVQKTGQATERTAGDDGTYQTGQLAVGRWDTSVAGLVIDNHTGLMWPAYPTKIYPGGSGLTVPHGNWADHAFVPGDTVDVATAADWATGQNYVAGNVRRYSSGLLGNFICIANHTSDATNRMYNGTGTGAGAWTEFWAPHVYICKLAHTDSVVGAGTTTPATGAAWTTYWDRYNWATDAPAATPPKAPMRSWYQAITQCEGLTYCGFSDWRLPNINELMSLNTYVVRAGGVYNVLDATAFTQTTADATPYNDFWASTSRPDAGTTTSYIASWLGEVLGKTKVTGYSVMPVRGPLF
jgi:hypothetical protein